MSNPSQPPLSPTGAFLRSEPIPGYRIVDLLGRGGYGEVWRAIAPGGIPKALKVVFGGGDASQAETELKAVARIKDVRHPLLLSIERVEVVDGNLVIVTELADCSLKEHYQRLRQAQAVGVPQMELLRFVADAAEALDFLYESHSLQHLDVKPENILLISNRAKLGDFGLLKHLYDRSASLVGGLTPTYAPPELFEGKPNRNSDQYSLALVYMQMLTGTLPFAGNNTAQIAAQHLHGVPDLSPLPKAQRPVIARALSKDPGHRYESCLAMVAALQESLRSVELPPPAPAAALPRSANAYPPGVARPGSSFAADAGAVRPAGSSLESSIRESESLSCSTLPVQIPGNRVSSTTQRPAGSSPPVILVGVGGAGTDVLAGILNRLRDRHGSQEHWPAVEFLALDSNVRPLNSRFREEDLPHVQIVPIPLKAAEAYSERSGDYLRWISRRWLYNISRDLTTGGYRPLGRLALMTNGPRVRDAIRAIVSRVAASEGQGAQPPRVLVIGSICGGTGSGAILDLSYAIRAEMKQRGLSDEQVHGLLLYAAPRSNLERDKARANAYAALSELYHYSAPGSHYPGETMLGVPPFHGNNPTFTRAHLLHLGDCPGEAGWKFATEQVAEFAYAASFTAASSLLHMGGEPGAAPIELRSTELATYRVLSLGLDGTRTVSQSVQSACQDVVRLWQEGRRPETEQGNSAHLDRTARINTFSKFSAPQAPQTAEAERQLAVCQLELEQLLQDAAEVVQLEVAADPDQFTRKLVDDSLEIVPAGEGDNNRETTILAMIDRYLRCDFREGYDDLADDQFFVQIVGRLTAQTRNRVKGLMDWIRKLVDQPEVRLDGARKNALALQQLLQSLQESALAQSAALHRSAQEIAAALRAEQASRSERSRFSGWTFRKRNPHDELRELLHPYAQVRLQELLHRAVAKLCRVIDTEIGALVEQLHRFSRDLTMLVGTPRGGQPTADASEQLPDGFAPAVAAYRQLLRAQLEHRRNVIAKLIDEQIEKRIRHQGIGLCRFLDSQAELQKSLGEPLVEVARQVVLESIQEINCQLLSACVSGVSPSQTGSESLSDLIVLIARGLDDRSASGPDSSARVLIVPEEADASNLRQQLQAPPLSATIIPGRKCDVTMCNLRDRVAIEQAAREIIGGIDLYKELASRLHSRIDVAWQPFAPPAAVSRPTVSDGITPSNPMHTAVLPVAGRPGAADPPPEPGFAAAPGFGSNSR